MKAMILAAGRGERLRPLTDSIPKTMVPIGDKPLLEHVVRLLSSHGFEELVINLHHQADQILSFVEEKREFGVDVRFSIEESQPLGTGGGLAAAGRRRLGLGRRGGVARALRRPGSRWEPI